MVPLPFPAGLDFRIQDLTTFPRPLGKGSPDRGLSATVVYCQLRHGLPTGVPLGDPPLLAGVEDRLTAELGPLSLGPFNPFRTPLAD
jgi:hypothetical protein